MLRKILSLGSNFDFIEVYDNALSKKECDIIISHFEKSELKCRGRVNSGGKSLIKPESKNSYDLFKHFSDTSHVSNIINQSLCNQIDKYKIKYNECDEMIGEWSVEDGYNIQKYSTDKDGYKMWHCESGNIEISKRVMAWMFYLNNAKSGTEFGYYPTINPREGRCVIWPASWTHVHKGVIPNKGIKYIVTGWVNFL